MRPWIKKIKLPIYDSIVIIRVSDDPVLEYNKLQKKYHSIGEPIEKREGDITHALSVSEDDNVGTYWILLHFECPLPVVVHECFHASIQILKDHDILISDPTEEAGAYLIEHLFKEISLFLNKKRSTSL